MLGLILVVLVAVPIAELYVIIKVAGGIGVLNTLVLLVVISIAGASLLKREGAATWRRFNEQLATGRVPAKEATDGAMILFGGALLLTPGFITDIVGLILILPPTRAAVKGLFRRAAAGWVGKRSPAGHAGYRVYDATVTRSRRNDGATPPGEPVSSSARPLPERPEDDSPDRG